MNKHHLHKKAQSVIEFTFAMIAVMLLMFGLVRIFQWAGMDMAERRFDHEATFNNPDLTPEEQLSPNFHRPRKINGVYRGFDL